MSVQASPRTQPSRMPRVLVAGIVGLSGTLAPATPSIEVDPLVLDFGERGHMEYPTAPLVIRNRGDETLRILEIYSSCDCTKWSLVRGGKVIAPGEETELRIRLATGPVVGELHKYIRITSNDPAHGEVRVPVRAAVHANIRMTPRFLPAFYGAKERDPVTQVVEVAYRKPQASPMRLEKLRTSTPYFSVRKEPLGGSRKGQGCRVHVSLLPSAPEGRIRGTIEGELDGKRWVLRVHGEMFRGIRVRPSFVNFNRIDAPARATARFQLDATDGFPFEILEIRARPAWLRFEVRENETFTGYEITARVATGERPDPFYGKVHVLTSHPEKPEIVIPFSGFFPKPRKAEGGRPPRRGAGEASGGTTR